MCQLWSPVYTTMAQGWHRTLSMQRLWPLSQDEWGQPTTSEAPEASGECGRERARATKGIKGLAGSYKLSSFWVPEGWVKDCSTDTIGCPGLLVGPGQFFSSWSLKNIQGTIRIQARSPNRDLAQVSQPTATL